MREQKTVMVAPVVCPVDGPSRRTRRMADRDNDIMEWDVDHDDMYTSDDGGEEEEVDFVHRSDDSSDNPSSPSGDADGHGEGESFVDYDEHPQSVKDDMEDDQNDNDDNENNEEEEDEEGEEQVTGEEEDVNHLDVDRREDDEQREDWQTIKTRKVHRRTAAAVGSTTLVSKDASPRRQRSGGGAGALGNR